MTKRNQKHRRTLGAGALAAPALSGTEAWRTKTDAAATRLARETAARSKPLCRALASDASNQTLTVETSQTAHPDGRDRPFWLVSCTDSMGADQAHLTWNARSGMLEAISQPTPTTWKPLSRAITGCQAAALAAAWLRRLPVAPPSEGWRVRSGFKSRSTWHFAYDSGTRQARVVIHEMTDQLLSAFAYQKRGYI